LLDKTDGIFGRDNVTIVFVAVGIRKQRDKKDIYRIAEKIVEYQILDNDDITIDGEDSQADDDE